MKFLREILAPSSSMILKERKSVVGALNPQMVDIYQQRAMTPHQMMEEVNNAYSSNPIFRSAVDTCSDFIFGGDITFKSDDKITEERGQAYVKTIGLNNWILDVIRETIKCGNGYVEVDYNPITELPQKFYPQADSSRWYINCDAHGDPLKHKKIVQTPVGYEYKEVDNLDEFYIQRISPGVKYPEAKWYNLSYYLDQKFRQFRIYGIPIHKEKMIHFKLNVGNTGVYGQSYLASAINDNLILQELEKSIAVLAKYKAVPRKVIQYGDKDNPATGEELDDFIIYLESLQRDEDPVVNKPIKLDDLSYAGREINVAYMLDHIRKKLTSGVVPDFLTGFGTDVNRSTAQVQLISYILSIYSKRRFFLYTLEERVIDPWLEKEGLEVGHLEFNELDFETKQEKTGRVMQLWTSNLITLNEALDELGKNKVGEEGNAYYVEWQNNLMSRSQQPLGSDMQPGLNEFGIASAPPVEPQLGETPQQQGGEMELFPENYNLELEERVVDGRDPLSPLVNQTALNIRKHYKRGLDEVKKVANKKTLERLKEDLKIQDIRELTTLLRLGGEDIKPAFNQSVKQAFLKGIEDGGKQIGLISGVPIRAEVWNNIQKNSWRWVKKGIDTGTEKVETVLYKGLMGELVGDKLESEVGRTYNFISWKSEQLAETELRKAYTSGIRHTMENSPYKKFKYFAHDDEKTCEYCWSKNGKEYSVNDFNAPYPPHNTHVNCRCHIEVVK